MIERFSTAVQEKIRLKVGGYRRDHLCALAQRVEVGESELRIIGSKSRLQAEKNRRLSAFRVLCQGGGETGIRTLGAREGTTVFETAPFDRSGTSPSQIL